MQAVVTGLMFSLLIMLTSCAQYGPKPEQTDICLAISRFPDRHPLAEYPLPPEGVFSLSFIHSVSLTPVRDDYQLTGGEIIQTAEIFTTHGAGLPSGFADEGVTGWEQADGRFIIRLHRPIRQMVVRTDGNYRNRLHLGHREVNLNLWPDQALELTPIPCRK